MFENSILVKKKVAFSKINDCYWSFLPLWPHLSLGEVAFEVGHNLLLVVGLLRVSTEKTTKIFHDIG